MEETICRLSIDTNYNDSYFDYEDFEMIVEGEKYNGENKITYTPKVERNHPVIHEIEDNDLCSIYAMQYFYYILKNGSIPTFHRTVNGAVDYTFDTKPKKMEFTLSYPQDCMYCLELGNDIFIFNEELESPYKFEEHLYMEIHIVDNKLFIIDHSQHEFYAMDNDYNTILTGRLNENGQIIEFIERDTYYHIQYMDGAFNNMTSSDENETCFYLRRQSDYYCATYYVPFAKTSYGIKLSTETEKIYCNHIIETPEEDQVSETITYKYSEDLSRSFNSQIENL